VKGVFTIAFTLIVVATIFYWLVERWSLLDSFYFSIVTIATVGYGDITAETAVGKIFTMAYIVAGIGIFVLRAGQCAASNLLRNNCKNNDVITFEQLL
jgi:hypothetical protein